MNTYFKLLALVLIVNQGISSDGAAAAALSSPLPATAASLTEANATAEAHARRHNGAGGSALVATAASNGGQQATIHQWDEDSLRFTAKSHQRDFNVMSSFSGIHRNLSNTQAFKDYVVKRLNGLPSELVPWFTRDTSLPQSQQWLLDQFQAEGYKQYIQNLASFTGGGAKGMMEILAVVTIEEILNGLDEGIKGQIIERRVRRYFAANPEFLLAGQEAKAQNIRARLLQDQYIYFQDVVDEFAGTSTGSIIAAGLAYMAPVLDRDERIVGFTRYKAYEVAQLYYRHLPDIFTSSGVMTSMRINQFGVLWAQYNKNNLKEMLESFFGRATIQDAFPYKNIKIALTDISKRVSIPSFAQVDDSFWGTQPIAFAVEGSSSAPTFFTPLTIGERIFVDGGICANSLVEKLTEDAQRKYTTGLLNVISFGAGKEPTNRTPGTGGNLVEALGCLKGNVSGQVVGAHTKCLELLKKGHIKSLTHLNPELLLGMELDSVSSEFVFKAFQQAKAELNTEILTEIMKQLLDFLPPLDIPNLIGNFEVLWKRTYHKVVLIDFTKVQEATSSTAAATQSQVSLHASAHAQFRAQRKWHNIHLERLTTDERTKVLAATMNKNPFGNFKHDDEDYNLLRIFLTAVFREEQEADTFSCPQSQRANEAIAERVREIIDQVRGYCEAQPEEEYKPNFDLLLEEIREISALLPENPKTHAPLLARIIQNHGVAYHNAQKLGLLFNYYTDKVFKNHEISNFKLIADDFDRLMLAEHSSVGVIYKWLAGIFADDVTSRGSVFRAHLIGHNEKIRATARVSALTSRAAPSPNAAATKNSAATAMTSGGGTAVQHQSDGDDDEDEKSTHPSPRRASSPMPCARSPRIVIEGLLDELMQRDNTITELLSRLRHLERQIEELMDRLNTQQHGGAAAAATSRRQQQPVLDLNMRKRQPPAAPATSHLTTAAAVPAVEDPAAARREQKPANLRRKVDRDSLGL